MAVIAAVSGLMNWQTAVREPPWLDELHSLWTLEAGLGEIATRAAAGNQMPGWFWLGGWIQSMGVEPIAALRGISSVSGAILVLFGGSMVWKTSGSGAGAVAAGLCAGFFSSQAFYATEARPYELLCLAGTVHACLLFGRLARPKGWTIRTCAGWCLASGGLVLLHPTAVLLLAGEAVMAVVLFHGRFCPFGPASRGWAVSRTDCEAAGVLAALGFPCLMMLLVWPRLGVSLEHRELWLSIADPESTVADWLRAMFLAVLTAAAGVVCNRLRGSRRRASGSVFTGAGSAAVIVIWLSGCSLCVLLLALGLDILDMAPLALPRYLMAAGGLPFVLAGLAVACLPTRRFRLVALPAILAVLIALPLPFGWSHGWQAGNLAGWVWAGGMPQFPRFRNEDWDGVWESVFPDGGSPVGETGPVFLMANLLEDSLLDPNDESSRWWKGLRAEYHRFPAVAVDRQERHRIQPRRTLFRPRFSARDIEQVVAAKVCFLVVRGEPALESEIAGELQRRIESSSAGVKVVRNRITAAGEIPSLITIRLSWPDEGSAAVLRPPVSLQSDR